MELTLGKTWKQALENVEPLISKLASKKLTSVCIFTYNRNFILMVGVTFWYSTTAEWSSNIDKKVINILGM